MTNFKTFLLQYGAYLALIPALSALLGSLYYSEVAGYVPCTLCWYQRILMYPLSIIILVGIITRDELLPNYVLPFAVIGLGVAFYHYLIQVGVFSHPTTCQAGIPCDLRWVNYLGFITIPFMSLAAFTLITLIMGAVKWADMQIPTVRTADMQTAET